MENTVNIEFKTTINKSIYENSPWNTREKFFNQMVVSHIDRDANLYERESGKMESPEKEKYSGLVKTLKEIKKSIQDSIQYELCNVKDNTEEVKIGFSFQYYDNPIFSKNDVVEKIIFNQSIKDSNSLAERLPKMDHGANEEKLKSAVDMYRHVADFMEKGKLSLTVNGESIEKNKVIVKKEKLKM